MPNGGEDSSARLTPHLKIQMISVCCRGSISPRGTVEGGPAGGAWVLEGCHWLCKGSLTEIASYNKAGIALLALYT